MRLCVHLPVAGKSASPEIILQVAVEAERIGLDSVWSWERLMRLTVPIALGGAGGPVIDAPEAFGIVYDPIETLAYVAARHRRCLGWTTSCGCGRRASKAGSTPVAPPAALGYITAASQPHV
jgi:alkanesulfonate monooxygenase SsuD/methylene tetrahydromethanopterin reductase-like flavin-dependent oxidoreductase (luciferase family)